MQMYTIPRKCSARPFTYVITAHLFLYLEVAPEQNFCLGSKFLNSHTNAAAAAAAAAGPAAGAAAAAAAAASAAAGGASRPHRST